MDLFLTNKVALVTGASAGIGKAVAQELAREGCRLVLCARNQKPLEEVSQLISTKFHNSEVITVCADAQNGQDSFRIVEGALRRFGEINILINNTEGSPFYLADPENISEDEWHNILTGKLLGYIRMTNLVLPIMKKKNWGRIINLVGLSGKEPSVELLKTGVVNAGLMNFTKAVAKYSAEYNILINSINPGFIETSRFKQFVEIQAEQLKEPSSIVEKKLANKIPARRPGCASEVASLIAFLASERASYITGTTIPVDGGLSTSVF
ncbi:SDR family oxidoreductase [Leptolyngbya sp. 7M]|uniref:SDR family oxidoreductase n=1 Tax=Leptolyngbya sp. 7M TaxID=2812896 RepID=UPI001B8C18A8|nr:SDR family oxidoreductase [Leptolyngbya sp. 7M]QYO67519.1 SDR family oxidoreductase [Leptolyngbya sp. 7M]